MMPIVPGFTPTPVGVPPTPSPNSPALDGLAPDVVEAITAGVTPEMINWLLACLSGTPKKQEVICRELRAQALPWFPVKSQLDTQKRLVRRIHTCANWQGYPICSSNDGLFLGTKGDVLAAAERESALSRGAAQRAFVYQRLADQLP